MSAERDPLAALIEADESVGGPGDEALGRMWTRIEAGVASGSAGPVLDTKPLLAPTGGVGLKVLGVALVAALGGTAIVAATQAPPRAHHLDPLPALDAPIPDATPVVDTKPVPVPELAPDAPAAAPAPSRESRPARPAPRPRDAAAAPTTPKPGLPQELALMRRIARALAESDAEQAASLVQRHRRRFPDGALQEERAAAQVRIACLRGDASAKKRRAAFERRWPKSMHAAAIEASCGD